MVSISTFGLFIDKNRQVMKRRRRRRLKGAERKRTDRWRREGWRDGKEGMEKMMKIMSR